MIEIKELSYFVKSRPILENINLKIKDKDFVAIIGPNGAGKSTLLKLILNLLPLQKGDIIINNQKHNKYLKENQVAYLPQFEDVKQNFPLKVMDLVLMGRMFNRKILSGFSSLDKEIAQESLELVDALHLAKKQINSLSGGEYQRVLLARALATQSDYIFLDEPEAGIDKKGIIGFYELLAQLNKNGKTIIAVSHDLERLSAYCKIVVCLNKTMHCHGTPDNINYEIVHQLNGE